MTGALRVGSGGPLRGQFAVQGDKSISHRSLIFNGFAAGRATVRGLLEAEDVAATARCMQQLGASIRDGQVIGCGGRLVAPDGALDCGNSGTTMRLLLGLLSGQPLSAELRGDESLSRRPMARVTDPLSEMGAHFSASHAPITVTGGRLVNGSHTARVASAQVKTALMLAALQGEGTLRFEEPACSRDHTERMLGAMGIVFSERVEADGRHILTLDGGQVPIARDVVVPGDISSAAFFLVAGSIVSGSDLIITGVGLNPSRTGVLDVLGRMGADIEVLDRTVVSGEPLGDLRVRAATLSGVEIGGGEIPRLIDELPVIAVAAALAEGDTIVRDAAELRVKESDRIAATVGLLNAMGVDAVERPDGMMISGRAGEDLSGAVVSANGDHRIAMSAAVAGLRGKCETVVQGAGCISTSFPSFPSQLEQLRV